MKILVTGATGYIGSALAEKLARSGHIVHALARSPDKLKCIEHPNIIPFKGDITDVESIRRAMEGCEQVYHAAAYVKVWAADPSAFYDLNVLATKQILTLANELKVRKIVYTSTAGIFGASIRSIVNEEKIRDIDFFNEYEGSKALSESVVRDAVIRDGMDVVIVSPTRVYGPSLNGVTSSVNTIIEKFNDGRWRWIFGDGNKIGNYIYIDDVVDGHIAAMEKGVKGRVYLLAGPNHSYHHFFNILKDLTGNQAKLYRIPVGILQFTSWLMLKRAELFGTEPLITPKWIAKVKYNWEVSPARMENELNIKARSLEAGIQSTLDWLNEGKRIV